MPEPKTPKVSRRGGGWAARRAKCLEVLKGEAQNEDHERGHRLADEALVALIDDAEVKAAYEAISKWYA